MYIGVVLSLELFEILGHPLVPEQRIEGGLAPAESLERLHRWPAAAGLEDRLPVFSPGFDAGQAIFIRGFLEGRIRVGAQYLGPLVAVIARRVAAREDVTERVGQIGRAS